MERLLTLIRRPDPEKLKREAETKVALKEARSIVEEHKLPQRVRYGIDINALEILSDNQQKIAGNTRVILRVPRRIFPKLVTEKQVTYVYEWPYPNDNTGGYGDRIVWFVTENKLRVSTETGPIDGGFMENILYPSYLAQLSEVQATFGDRKTSFDEISSIMQEKGFSVYDPLVGLGGAWVSRVKLLPPNKAENFKGSLIAFRIGPNSNNSYS